MKKRIVLFAICVFMLGLFTQAFAKENNSEKKDLAKSEVKADKNTLTENSPLIKAIRALDLSKVEEAVEQGADVNGRLNDEDNSTPLHILAGIPQNEKKAEKAKQIADFLIDQGADINARAKKGETPLHFSILKNNNKISKFFIDKGADIHARTNSCEEPMHNARNKEILEFLISKGADKYARDCTARLLVHRAARRGDLEILKFYLDEYGEGSLSYEDQYKRTPLCYASCADNIDAVKFLVDNKAEVNITERKILSPLDCAIGCGKIESVKFLIANGADVNEQKSVMSPLCTAVNKNNIKIVKLLLSNGADINLQSALEETPLDTAIRVNEEVNNMEMIKFLISKGADVNMLDTPLSFIKNEEVKQLLLKHGAKSGKALK